MRGTGSLQQLLGRSTFTSSLRKRTAENVEASTSDAVEDVCPSTVAAVAAQPIAAAESSPLKAGFIRCPVCQKQLEHSHGDELINAHLGMCIPFFPLRGKKKKKNAADKISYTRRKPTNQHRSLFLYR